MLVYLIFCPESGKGYVGQTVQTLEKRWYRHCADARKEVGYFLHRAIRKYGEDAFELSILAETDNLLELNRLETEHIKKQNTKVPNGYNLTEGGEGNSGHQHTPETKAKIAAAHLGVQTCLGHHHSEETGTYYGIYFDGTGWS
jgi:group I intron endonuclease